MNQKYVVLLFLIVVIISISPAHAGATDTALDTAQKISTAINSLTLPYEKEYTISNLKTIGMNTDTLNRPYGTYKIRIKSASYNATTGTLTLNMYAWHNGTRGSYGTRGG